jgi:AcrR family transcriptional regulator
MTASSNVPRDRITQRSKRRLGRPTFEESLQLRKRIARCALDAFKRDGFKATSIEAIARAAKITKLTIYRQFETKEKLFIEAALLGMEKMNLRFEAAINYREDVEVILRRVVIQTYSTLADPEVAAVARMAIFEAGRDPVKAAHEFRNSAITLAPLIEYLRWLAERNGFVIPDPEKAALQLTALATDGMRVFFERTYSTKVQLDSHAASVVTLLLNGWKRR